LTRHDGDVMRWCRYCGKVNGGWPLRCRFCGIGLAGRLCPRNHISPADCRLTYCGECGGPLEPKSGSGLTWLTSVVAIGLVSLGLGGAFLLLYSSLAQEAPMTSLLIAAALLLLATRMAIQILPPSAREALAWMFSGFGRTVYLVLFGNR
jgi:hypothetical protein